MPQDVLPPDPFADDPNDPAREIAALDADQEGGDGDVIGAAEREELLADLADLELYQTLLERRGVRDIVVDCGECEQPHYHDWHLLRASLEQLLADGSMRPHEPAYDPDPEYYVSWDYCRGFADAATATDATGRTGNKR